MLALQLHVKGRSYLELFSRSVYIIKTYNQPLCINFHIKPAEGFSSNDVNKKHTSSLLCPGQLFHSSGYLANNNKGSLDRKTDTNKVPELKKVKVDPTRMSSDGYETMFSFGNIVLYQLASRMKIYQSVGTIVVLLCSLYNSNNENLFYAWMFSFGISSSFILGLFIASLHIKKIVGLIAINNTGDHIKLAHVSFWGRRKNLLIPIDNLVLPLSFDGRKYIIRLKNSPDVFYLIPSKARYYNPYLMDKVFGKLG